MKKLICLLALFPILLNAQNYNRSFASDSIVHTVDVLSLGDSTMVARVSDDKIRIDLLDENGVLTSINRVIPTYNNATPYRVSLLQLPNDSILLAYETGFCDLSTDRYEVYITYSSGLSPNSITTRTSFAGQPNALIGLKELTYLNDGNVLASGDNGFRIFSPSGTSVNVIHEVIYTANTLEATPLHGDSIFLKKDFNTGGSTYTIFSVAGGNSASPVNFTGQLVSVDQNYVAEYNKADKKLRLYNNKTIQKLDSVSFPGNVGFVPEQIFASSEGIVVQAGANFVVYGPQNLTLLGSGKFNGTFEDDNYSTSIAVANNKVQALGIVSPNVSHIEVFNYSQAPAPEIPVQLDIIPLNQQITKVDKISSGYYDIHILANWRIEISNISQDTLKSLGLMVPSGFKFGFCLPLWRTIIYDTISLAPGAKLTTDFSSFNNVQGSDTINQSAEYEAYVVMANENIVDLQGSTTKTTVNFTVSTPTFHLSDMEIYPNPVQDYCEIHLPENYSGNLRVEVINLAGQVVFNQAYSKSSNQDVKINLSDLPASVYFLKLYPQQGEVQMERLVKR